MVPNRRAPDHRARRLPLLDIVVPFVMLAALFALVLAGVRWRMKARLGQLFQRSLGHRVVKTTMIRTLIGVGVGIGIGIEGATT